MQRAWQTNRRAELGGRTKDRTPAQPSDAGRPNGGRSESEPASSPGGADRSVAGRLSDDDGPLDVDAERYWCWRLTAVIARWNIYAKRFRMVVFKGDIWNDTGCDRRQEWQSVGLSNADVQSAHSIGGSNFRHCADSIEAVAARCRRCRNDYVFMCVHFWLCSTRQWIIFRMTKRPNVKGPTIASWCGRIVYWPTDAISDLKSISSVSYCTTYTRMNWSLFTASRRAQNRDLIDNVSVMYTNNWRQNGNR